MKNQTEETSESYGLWNPVWSYTIVAEVSKVAIHFSLYKKVRNWHWVVRGEKRGKGTKMISTVFDILTTEAAILKRFVTVYLD